MCNSDLSLNSSKYEPIVFLLNCFIDPFFETPEIPKSPLRESRLSLPSTNLRLFSRSLDTKSDRVFLQSIPLASIDWFPFLGISDSIKLLRLKSNLLKWFILDKVQSTTRLLGEECWCLIPSTNSEANLRVIIPFIVDRVKKEMLGAGFQLTRGRHGEEPFYSSAKARKANQNPQQRIDHLRRAQSDVSNGRSADSKGNRECQNESSPQKLVPEPSSSNLDRFLESITPSVPAQFLSKVCLNMSNFISAFLYFIKIILYFKWWWQICVDIAAGKRRRWWWL